MNEKYIEDIVREVVLSLQPSSAVQTSDIAPAIAPIKMNLELAVKLIECVEAEAARMGIPVVVAVADAAGRPIAVHCMDGAYIGSYDIAVNKTYTAVAFKMSTATLAGLAAPGGSLYGIQHTNGGKIVIFGGGEPLYIGDELIGAIGVSGGSAEQDIHLGVYGKNKLKEVITWK